jgi:predicted PurR-regulated permease PerM
VTPDPASSRDDPRALIRYALISFTVIVMLVWTAYLVRGPLMLIYVSGLLAIGLAPLVAVVERQRLIPGRRLPRWVAILIIYLLFLTVFASFGRLVIGPLITQARELWAAFPNMLHDWQQWFIERGLLTKELSLREAIEQSPVGGSDAIDTIVGAVWGFIGGIFGLVTILILAFYLLIDSETLIHTFVRLFPRRERPRVERALRQVSGKVSAWLGGQLLLAAIIACSAALGLFLLGVPYFYVLALIAGIGEMIPIVGPILAALPAIAVGFSVSPAKALAVAAFFFVQQQVENHVLVPKIMERQGGISAAGVIIALLIGGTLLGVVGAILAVPTAAILRVVFEELFPEASAD